MTNRPVVEYNGALADNRCLVGRGSSVLCAVVLVVAFLAGI